MSLSEIELLDLEHTLELHMRSEGIRTASVAVSGTTSTERLTPGDQHFLLVDVFGELLAGKTVPLIDAVAAQMQPKLGRRDVMRVELEGLKPDAVAFCALRVLLDENLDKLSQQSVAIKIGEALEREARLSRARASSPRLWNQIQKISARAREPHSATGDNATQRDRVQRMMVALSRIKRLLRGGSDDQKRREANFRVGNKMLQLLLQHTDLFIVRHERRRPNVLALSIAAEARVAAGRSRLVRKAPPYYQPLVVPPREWTALEVGGYYTLPLTAIKVRGDNKYARMFKAEVARADLTRAYDALNALQGTGWRINGAVHDVMKTVELETAQQAPDLEDKVESDLVVSRGDEWIENKILPEVTDQSEDGHKQKEQYSEFSRLVELADLYRSRPQPFHFVWQYDFRGRAYPAGRLLQPQGNDTARASLIFSTELPLGDAGEKWLALHGANMLEVSALKQDERIEAVHRLEPELLRVAKDPLGTKDFWLFEKKDVGKTPPVRRRAWRTLAFCFEWARFRSQGSKFQTGLPVSMDGTCNAIQHFAAMLRDPVLATMTNLAPAEDPADVYRLVARDACASVRAAEHSFEKELLLNMKCKLEDVIDRSLCKPIVMTTPYGVTKYGRIKQLRAALKENAHYTKALQKAEGGKGKSNSEVQETISRIHRDLSKYLEAHIYAAVSNRLGPAKLLMERLQVCAGLMIENGKPVRWNTPCGFPVVQAYLQNDSKIIKTEIAGATEFPGFALTLKFPTNELARGKAINGIVANFVHSHDAAHMMLTTLAAKREGIASLRMIHDSFATHAIHAGKLGQLLRQEFVSMYEKNDVLANFYESCRAQLPSGAIKRLEELPARGAFNLKAVEESKYFFS